MSDTQMQSPKSTSSLATSTLATFAEIAFVFGSMLAITWAAKSADLIGAGSIAIWGGILIATPLMARRGVRWADYGLTLPHGRKAWAKTAGLALAVIVTIFASMALVIAPLSAKLGLVEAADASQRFEFFLGNPMAFLGFIIGVVWVGAALGEELFMRGFMLNRLADLFGQGRLGWAAALITHAVIFGAMHAYQGLSGMLATGFVGFIFGLYYITGGRRLMPLILAHGIINTVGLTAYYLSDGAIT